MRPAPCRRLSVTSATIPPVPRIGPDVWARSANRTGVARAGSCNRTVRQGNPRVLVRGNRRRRTEAEDVGRRTSLHGVLFAPEVMRLGGYATGSYDDVPKVGTKEAQLLRPTRSSRGRVQQGAELLGVRVACESCIVTDLASLDLNALTHIAGLAVVASSRRGTRQVAPIGETALVTPFRIASLTKPLTAVATVLAARQRQVSLDTPVIDVLPALRGDWSADKNLTISEVLSQTSGLASTVTADEVLRLGDSDSVTLETARLVVRAGRARPPGRRWEYYNGNYFLAGAVIAALMDTTYEAALADLVLRPWQLASTSFDPPTDLAPGVDQSRPLAAAGYPRGRRPSGGLCSTAEDLLAFGEHILADTDLLAQVRKTRTRSDDPVRYGLGWAIGQSGQMYLNGRLPGYRAAMMLIPDYDLVAVSLAADSDALPAQASILNELQLALTGDDLATAIDTFAA